MGKQQKKLTAIIAIFLLFLASLLVKFCGPFLIRSLFENNHISLLNQIVSSTDNMPVDYYVGRIETLFFGPLSMLFSGIAFFWCSFLFLKDESGWKYFLAVLVYFLVTKFEILFFPPYGDSIGGPFFEAIWLKDNGFNYIGLSNQPSFIKGGPKVYLFSIYPTYIAALMRMIPNTKMFLLINHVLVFIYGSVCIVFFRKVCEKIFDKSEALLLSILLMAFPLFQSQVEGLNMEMPLVMFGIVALYYLVEKKVVMAAIMAIMSAMVKGVAVSICAAVSVGCLLLFIFDKENRFKFRILIGFILAGGFVLFKMYLSMVVLGKGEKIGMVGFMQGWYWIKKLPAEYMLLASFIVVSIVLAKKTIRAKTGYQTFADLINENFVIISAFICAFMWTGVFINSFSDAERYRLLLVPFNTICVFTAIKIVLRNRKRFVTLLTAIIFVLFLNSYGLCFPYITYPRAAQLERSLEYRIDMKVNIKATKKIEERASSLLIGAPHTITQMLIFPEIGYVTKRLNVMIYGYPFEYGPATKFNGLKHLDVGKTLWIAKESELAEKMQGFGDYPVDPRDNIIEEIYYGTRKRIVFLGGIAIEKMRRVNIEVLRQMTLKGRYKYRNYRNYGIPDDKT